MAAHSSPSAFALEFKNVTKAFGDCVANSDVSFSVRKGTIHAVIGENGAGKSTLMKILFGLYQPTRGEIFVHGKKLEITSPTQAKALGLGMVHQHFMLTGAMTALDHMILEEHSPDRLDRKKTLQELEALSTKYQMPVHWLSNIENLSVGIQQRIEILKILRNSSDILIFDEPTAVLNPIEITEFLERLKDLRQEGKTILLISHKLKEVLSVADDFSVLRHGQLVHSGSVSGQNVDSLGELMVGRKLQPIQTQVDIHTHKNTDLVVSNLSAREENLSLHSINFTVKPGEILGVAGVEGNGQSLLLKCLLRPDSISEKSGSIFYKKEFFASPSDSSSKLSSRASSCLSSQEIRDLDVAYLPEDRLHHGVVAELNLIDNFLLGHQQQSDLQKNGLIQWSTLKNILQKKMQEFDVRPNNIEQELQRFSGGNQQKFVVARELHFQPQLLIAAQPTRGVDIGAIEMIHQKLIALKQTGAIILLVSSELDELFKLSDRIVVMNSGRMSKPLTREHFDETHIGRMMGDSEAKI